MAFPDLTQIERMMRGHNGPRPGDSDYPEVQLPPFAFSERMFLTMGGDVSHKKERAFTIANKATIVIDEQEDINKCSKMGYHALSLDPDCLDAWRNLTKCMNHVSDGDTVICALREIIKFARPFFHDEFTSDPGMFYKISTTRPYIRLLADLASIAYQSERLDLTIYSYEEIIRLNNNDNAGVRYSLLPCYLEAISRHKRLPSFKPVRTVQHAEALINAVLLGTELFEQDCLTVRWAKIILAYEKKENWKDLAKAELKKNPFMFDILFKEKKLSDLKPLAPNGMGYIAGNPSEEVRVNGYMIQECFKDWPELLIELYTLIKGKAPSKKFKEDAFKDLPNIVNESKSEYKESMKALGDMFLDKGREALTQRKFQDAYLNFTLAKRSYTQKSIPSQRTYLHMPFAIVSNRATCAYFLSWFQALRVDVRFTLQMKPDHKNSYTKISKIATAFRAKQLIPELEAIEKDVTENANNKTKEEWEALSKRVIGLLSITALTLAAKDELTDEKKDELIKEGIENMFDPVNVPAASYPILPWLTPADLEPAIPMI